MRLSSETKHSFKTTEFWAMVAVIVGILVASKVVGQGDGNGNGGDAFPAVRAWTYIAIVTVGYMVSRGLAKAGSRDPYWANPDDLSGRDADRPRAVEPGRGVSVSRMRGRRRYPRRRPRQRRDIPPTAGDADDPARNLRTSGRNIRGCR
jgi:hypothetical protein